MLKRDSKRDNSIKNWKWEKGKMHKNVKSCRIQKEGSYQLIHTHMLKKRG